MNSPERAEYTSFPTFSTWNAVDVSYRDVDSATSRFSELKETVSQEALDRVLDMARRAAAVDTNAIEGIFTTDRGFTRTVAEKAGAWEQAMADKGSHVRPAFEDTLAGFELVLDRMTGKQPVTAHFIRELHATMLRSQATHTVYVPVAGELVAQTQQPPKGEYKEHANSPTRPDGTVHAYAPVEDTAPEVDRLIRELRSEEFDAAHPVTQAAYAHYGFVCIHPFADGNGRVARALASIYLYRSPGVPLVIYQDQRTDYLDALEAADRGQFHTLMRFIAERVTDTVHLLDGELSVPPLGTSADALSAALNSNRVSPAVATAAERLKEILRERLQTRIDRQRENLGLPFGTMRSLIGDRIEPPAGYRAIDDDMATGLYVTTRTPRKIHVFWPVMVCARLTDDADFDVIAVTGSGRHIGVYVRELMPTVNESFRQRAGFFADAVVEEFLAKVMEAVSPTGQ